MTSKYGVLITGCTGFVGSYLTRELLSMGCRVFALARAKGLVSGKQRVKQLIDTLDTALGLDPVDLRNLTVLTGDLQVEKLGLDSATIGGLIDQVHEVWHCAANTSFKNSNAKQIKDVNVRGTKRILRLTQVLGAANFHHLSTAFLCGARDGTVYEDELRVGQAFRNIYEESKCDAEALVKTAVAQHGLDGRIYRLGIVVGDSQTGMATQFSGFYNLARYLYAFSNSGRVVATPQRWRDVLGQQLIKYVRGKEIRVPAHRGTGINLVTIDYVVRLLLALGANERAARQTFHITNPEPPSAEMLFTSAFKFFDLKDFRIARASEIRKSPAKNLAVRLLERRLISRIQPYSAYLEGETRFDNQNVRRILPCNQLRHSVFDYDLVSRLLSFAVASGWGKAGTS